MEGQQISQDLYRATRDDLLKRQLSNSENFDRSVLTLSSAAIGLSLTFVHHLGDTNSVHQKWLFISTCALCAVAILLTLISFHVSQFAIETQLKHAEEYYLKNDDAYLTKKNWPAEITKWMGYSSAVVFCIAMLFLVCFIASNI